MTSASRRPIVAALTGVLVSVLLLGGCSGSEALDVGAVAPVAAADAQDAGGPGAGAVASVVVPTGTLDLTIGSPVEELGSLAAPDGGSLLRITTSFRDAVAPSAVWRFAGRADAARPVALLVTVGGTTYDVGTVRRASDGAGTVPGDLVVALTQSPAEAADLRVGVSYDGLVQTVALDGTRDPGPADALYVDDPRPSDQQPRECTDVRYEVTPQGGLPGSTGSARCTVVRADAVPYLPDLGWAEEGRTWVTVSLTAQVEPMDLRGNDGPAAYELAEVGDRDSSLGDSSRLGVLDAAPVLASGWSGTLLFEAPVAAVPAALDVRLLATLVPAGGQVTTDPARGARLSATVALDPAVNDR